MAPVRTGLPKKGSRPSSSDSHHRTRETKKKKKKKQPGRGRQHRQRCGLPNDRNCVGWLRPHSRPCRESPSRVPTGPRLPSTRERSPALSGFVAEAVPRPARGEDGRANGRRPRQLLGVGAGDPTAPGAGAGASSGLGASSSPAPSVGGGVSGAAGTGTATSPTAAGLLQPQIMSPVLAVSALRSSPQAASLETWHVPPCTESGPAEPAAA
mmetsp:Transcript_45022/g.121316  ORF Transcript_45022/g.121316 Transcript_45022/m.121316 type:complete len:211 (-) Transcript_45022:1543-2175(-)